MRAARFAVTPELLREALHMPPGSRIIEASVTGSGAYDLIEFVAVDDDTLPEADEPQQADPTITRIEGVPERFVWKWNAKT